VLTWHLQRPLDIETRATKDVHLIYTHLATEIPLQDFFGCLRCFISGGHSRDGAV
jgi:hypothetical protein